MLRHDLIRNDEGYSVYVDMLSKTAGRFLNHQPYVVGLVKEVLLERDLKDQSIEIEEDMGRVIGVTDVISTSDTDLIYYARPVGSTQYMRYAKNRLPTPSNLLTLRLTRDDSGDYEVTEVWIGPNTPPFPTAEAIDEKCRDYWDTHAVAHKAHPVQSRTVTKVAPY